MPSPVEWYERSKEILRRETCKHPDSEPDDYAACFGFCPDCGAENIENTYEGHYPCDNTAHREPGEEG